MPPTDEGEGHALVEGRDGGPLPCALLASGVPDLLHEGLAVGVLEGEDVGGDLDEEGVQLTLVPLLQYLCVCVCGKRHPIAQIISSLVPRPPIAAFFSAVKKTRGPFFLSTAVKQAVREGLGTKFYNIRL